LFRTVLIGDSKKTVGYVLMYNKPGQHVHSGQEDGAQALRDFVADNEINSLNVARPRASNEPNVGQLVKDVLQKAFPV
jgi:hypothetical protein